MNQNLRKSRLKLTRIIFLSQFLLIALLVTLTVIGYFWHVGSFPYAFLMGSLGGSIALMRRIRNEKAIVIEELAADMTSSLMPLLYGGIMAGVVYLLFMSGILSGDGGGGLFTSNLFPSFTTPNSQKLYLVRQFIEMQPMSLKDVGKLLVWCFIAGYSEKFVTGILKQLEQSNS